MRRALVLALVAGATAGAARAQEASPAPVASPATSCALSPADEAALEAATREAIARVSPSVVEVECLGGLEEEFKAPEDESQAEGGVLARKGFKQAFGPTTGLLVSKDGLVLTTSFAVRREPRHIIVTLGDGRSFVAKVRGRDEARSLVLLSIEGKDLPVPRMAAVDEVRAGRFAIALGRGLGGAVPAVSRGIISAIGRVGGLALQSSAAISPVNYGGPLVAIDGAVLGLLVPLALTGGMASVDVYDSGIGFAIPAPDLVELLPRLAKGETLRPGMMGIVPAPEHTGAGVRVEAVAPGSPAAQAGIEAGDLITRVGGDVTLAPWQLRRALARLHEGDRVQVEVKHGPAVRTVEVKLAPVPRAAEGEAEGEAGPHGAPPHPPGPGPGAPPAPGPAPGPGPGGGRSP